MSPNINSFVGDLVAMAQAMEELPKAQDRIADLERQLDEAQRHNQGLEQNILGYKSEIDHWKDNAKVLTDQRDNAEWRAMELEDRNNAVSRFLGSLMGEANSLRNVIDPPQPPTLEQPVEQPSYIPSNELASASPAPQSIHDPMADSTTPADVPQAVVATPHPFEGNGGGMSQPVGQVEAPQSPPNPSPYSGKLYHYCREWMPLSDWLAGGGSEFSYNWRPSLGGSVPTGYESQPFEKNGEYSPS